MRIEQRVALGGHTVPECDVRRRYNRSLNNFKDIIPNVSHWELYYNGGNNYILIARGKGDFIDIINEQVYHNFVKRLKNDKK